MARRVEHGGVRTAPPRRKDLARVYTAPDRSRNHGPDGRFKGGNDAASRKAIRAQLKRQLGAGTTSEELEALFREVMVEFRSLLLDLPASDAAEVQSLTARRARWAVLSARYALQAAEVGLFTDEGMRLLDVALKLDARAERLAVTARDEAERLADARGEPDPGAANIQAAQVFAAPPPLRDPQ